MGQINIGLSRWEMGLRNRAQKTQNEGNFLGGAGLREMLQLEALGNREPKTEVGFTKAFVQRPARGLPAESVPGTAVGSGH